ncbi:MAG: hypothetical protein QM711_18050 [Micropruina sp.]|uniref:hypothetical protein n=1 Tax=Micropruina sp. TaxID=2737536 RepID=UPI0039E3AEC7
MIAFIRPSVATPGRRVSRGFSALVCTTALLAVAGCGFVASSGPAASGAPNVRASSSSPTSSPSASPTALQTHCRLIDEALAETLSGATVTETAPEAEPGGGFSPILDHCSYTLSNGVLTYTVEMGGLNTESAIREIQVEPALVPAGGTSTAKAVDLGVRRGAGVTRPVAGGKVMGRAAAVNGVTGIQVSVTAPTRAKAKTLLLAVVKELTRGW